VAYSVGVKVGGLVVFFISFFSQKWFPTIRRIFLSDKRMASFTRRNRYKNIGTGKQSNEIFAIFGGHKSK
jgi:hypothetical protein